MKSTDLMIGDWIFYPNNTPQKITGLAPGIDENGNIHYQFFNDVEWYELDSAKPIPLTPEILEKNGASFNDTLDVYCLDGLYLGYDEIEDNFDIGDIGVGFNGDEFHLFTTIEYVHELQHALKLCGIEKEIIL